MYPQQEAAAAAQGIRALNHATISQAGYTWPSDVDATVAELEHLAIMLPQALEQIEKWLTTQLDAGRIEDDRPGKDPAVSVEEALTWITAGIVHTRALARCLSAAHIHTAHLRGVDDST